MSSKARFLILSGDGINCENESQKAVLEAGAQAQILHVNELCRKPELLRDYQGLVFPGGFSFGDHLGSGQVLSLKMMSSLKEGLQDFIAAKKPVLGVCNGFQTLLRMGLLPQTDFARRTALVKNTQGHFIDRWVEVERNTQSPCIWTAHLPTHFFLPIRHGEGRFVCPDENVFKSLQTQGQIALRYTVDVNGSRDLIAGICDPTGLVFALMPHPEAALFDWQVPVTGQKAFGLSFFKSAVDYLRS